MSHDYASIPGVMHQSPALYINPRRYALIPGVMHQSPALCVNPRRYALIPEVAPFGLTPDYILSPLRGFSGCASMRLYHNIAFLSGGGVGEPPFFWQKERGSPTKKTKN